MQANLTLISWLRLSLELSLVRWAIAPLTHFFGEQNYAGEVRLEGDLFFFPNKKRKATPFL